MMDVRCPNCGTSFVTGNGNGVMEETRNGVSYLMPKTVRNENRGSQRMEALKAAGVDVSKLQMLLGKSEEIRSLFSDDDPVLEELSKGSYIGNPELFRRWITAQTFRLIKDKSGWTDAVRRRYNTQYVFKQTFNELKVLCKLEAKHADDVRFSFFTLEDMKEIFTDLMPYAVLGQPNPYYATAIYNCKTYAELKSIISSTTWTIFRRHKFLPRAWLRCFKGAGAYYTLQNIIRTHGFVLPNCKDMEEALEAVRSMTDSIKKYNPSARRWDLLMSLLTTSVRETGFELRY